MTSNRTKLTTTGISLRPGAISGSSSDWNSRRVPTCCAGRAGEQGRGFAQSGQAVQEMVVDYQKDVNGGNGWLRLLQVLPDGKTVRCQDYSPLINQRCTMPDRTFDFELAMPGK